ncbi:uncharacterized protein si:ch211-102c2.8 isoform X3 [Danio rerio]|uniref:Uncharacterized protein si:ch211-102c2.8 isoform X3 n=2 Tax=Danio rerio TaxID=7955 RepID=A0AC58JP85_DANRE
MKTNVLKTTSCMKDFLFFRTGMENDGSGENTDELLSADVDDDVDVYGLIPLSHDCCDVLLDTIDSQLSHLQIHKQVHEERYECPILSCLDGNQSVSKDTGLGSSTFPTNEKTPSTPDWTRSEVSDEHVDHQSMRKTGATVTEVWLQNPEGDPSSLSSMSRVEQCRWRLEKLLGRNTEVAGIGNEEDDFTMNSVCTEDFSTRFRDEMLVLPTSAPDALTSVEQSGKLQHQSRTPVRHLAGIPMQSFDSVTIDTDLDTVCSEQVRQHLKSALGNRTAFRLSRENEYCTGQTIQNNGQPFSSDDERTVEETSSEGAKSKLFYRRRHSSGRKGKRNLYKSRRNEPHIGTEKTLDKSRNDGNPLRELRISIAELQQQKTGMLHTLQKLREEVDQSKREHLSVQLSVKDSRAQVQNIMSELHRLQAQRDLCLEECVSRSVSVLEREEMDRLLENAKSELFSEQRRFRNTLDSMQERLDEVNQELEQREEDSRSLQEKYSELEKQLLHAIREKEQIKLASQKHLDHQIKRFGALERIVAQKELLLQGTQEAKEGLLLELCSLREAHSLNLREMQNRSKKDMEQEIEKLTLQLTKSHKEELQNVCKQADDLRSASLSDQAQIHKQSLDSLHNCIKMKDEEVKQLKEALKQSEEKMRRQQEEFRRETEEKIVKAASREQRKCEEQREKALQEQRHTLEQKTEDAVRKWRTELDKERRNTLALQSKLTELQKEAEKEAVCLKQTLLSSEKELQELRTALREREQKQQRRTARHEQQSRRWAQDIHAECVHLQELLKHHGLIVETEGSHSSDSSTVSSALQMLQSLTKSLQQYINDLKTELSTQRRAALQMSREKEQELRVQKEQLMEEKERALAALKEKLIQAHVEEMSSLSRGQLLMKNDEDVDGQCVHLRRQLKAKDEELRQVHNSMAQWKDKTTARIAHKFELELNAELERRLPTSKAEQQKRLERLENEMRHLTAQCRDHNISQLTSAAVQGVPDIQNSRVTEDLSSYKLLRHLQSRIQLLQAESQSRCSSPMKRDRENTDLGGSYLDMIASSQETKKTEDYLPAKSISC